MPVPVPLPVYVRTRPAAAGEETEAARGRRSRRSRTVFSELQVSQRFFPLKNVHPPSLILHRKLFVSQVPPPTGGQTPI